jgi:hypothetical protein
MIQWLAHCEQQSRTPYSVQGRCIRSGDKIAVAVPGHQILSAVFPSGVMFYAGYC